jgi:hypothetical protein
VCTSAIVVVKLVLLDLLSSRSFVSRKTFQLGKYRQLYGRSRVVVIQDGLGDGAVYSESVILKMHLVLQLHQTDIVIGSIFLFYLG